jgi:hypothetical protein
MSNSFTVATTWNNKMDFSSSAANADPDIAKEAAIIDAVICFLNEVSMSNISLCVQISLSLRYET